MKWRKIEWLDKIPPFFQDIDRVRMSESEQHGRILPRFSKARPKGLRAARLQPVKRAKCQDGQSNQCVKICGKIARGRAFLQRRLPLLLSTVFYAHAGHKAKHMDARSHTLRSDPATSRSVAFRPFTV